MTLAFLHPALPLLAMFQATQLNLFERFLTQAVAGIDSTSITSGMQNVAYVVLLVGFLWQVYQSALHGGDVRGLGVSLIKYVATAVVVMNYHAVFTTLNQGFVNAGNWVSSASGAGNLLQNWAGDLKTQFAQIGFQKMWGLITGSIAGLIDALLILVAYVLYPIVIVIFGFFYILYGSILYIFGPIVIALMPLGAANRLAKSYVENVFIWNAWPVLYGGFGALLNAVQMGQVGQMLNQNSFLGGLGNLEGSFLIGFASIIFSLAIAIIPFMAKKIVSGDVGATAGTLIGAAATAITAGAAAVEGAAAGATAAGSSGSASTGSAGSSSASAASGVGQAGRATGSNVPAAPQQGASTATAKPTVSSSGSSAATQSANGLTQTSPGSASGSSVSASGPSLQGHAEQMRGSLSEAMGSTQTDTKGSGLSSISAGTSYAQSSSSQGGGSPAGATSSAGSAGYRSNSGVHTGSGASSPKAPSARRDGIATWAAYHAVRTGAQGAVQGGAMVGNAIRGTLKAAVSPAESAARLGAGTGRAAGSVVNAASNTGQAISKTGSAIAHPAATAKAGAAAIGAGVSDAASRVAQGIQETANAAKGGFAVAYSETRRGNKNGSNKA